LQTLGVKKVAVATYYGDELNQAIVNYFSRFGLQSELMPGLSMTGESSGLYTTSLMALDEVSHMDVYRHCKRALAKMPPVDAVYINGGGWDAAPAIEYLERDLKIKVVWALAAEMWLTYHILRIENPVTGGGVLLSGNYAPAQGQFRGLGFRV
jgi:maleate cis-trans isomerase